MTPQNRLDNLPLATYAHTHAYFDSLRALLPSAAYIDLPDVGSVTLIERFTRMAKDAERYRWLRHGDNDETVLQRIRSYIFLPRNEKLDKMIDDAISKEME